MKRLFAIIGALLTGGLLVALTNASQAAYAGVTNATNMTNMSSVASDMMSGSISALSTN
ncbi:MAG: hypothetical protein WAK50_09375 [Nitrososphaeraceae archaeon]